jgi:hypothetical protein
VSQSTLITLAVGITQICPANPKRIATIIQNLDDAANPNTEVGIYLGGTNTIAVQLLSHGSLQIDQNLPWCGEINVGVGANAPIVSIIEISIP